jgi:hypothetical protein
MMANIRASRRTQSNGHDIGSGVRTPSRAAKVALAGLVVLSPLSLLISGCGQEDPAPPATVLEPYFPLVPGSWWEYAHSDWTERVETMSATYEGQDAFLMTDSPNPSDDLRSDSIVQSIDGRIARMSKEEYLVGSDGETLTSSVNYGAGFTRFNESWANQPVGFRDTPEYMRTETEPDGTVRAPEARKHTFEIISLSESVPTGKGTFDCIVIQRTKDWQAEEDGLDADEAQTKRFWFARGVGKVQERNVDTGRTEVLIDYSIPGGAGG